MRGGRWWVGVVALGWVGLGLGTGARRAEAVPAYARQLGGVSCNLCHAPIFPRLNRTGWQFRNAGYRMPADLVAPKPAAPVCAPPCPTGTSTAPPATAARGLQVYASQSCSACHRIGGQGGTLGAALDSPAVRRDQASLTAALRHPPSGSGMPAYTGSEADLGALVGYLQSLGAPSAAAPFAPMNDRDQLKAELKAEIMAELRAEHPDWFHLETQGVAAPPPASAPRKAGDFLSDVGNTISVMGRLHYDLINSGGDVKTFSQFSVAETELFLTGPMARNYGYLVEEVLSEQEMGFDEEAHRFVLEAPDSGLERFIFRYASGGPNRYFTAAAGQGHVVDGVQASSSHAILTVSPALWDLTINGFNLNENQRGVQVGFTENKTSLLVSALNGLNAAGSGTDEGRLSNLTDWLVQVVRFFGKENSALHLAFYDGHHPITEDETVRDDFTRVAAFVNFQKLLDGSRGRHLNLLGGYMKGRHTRFISSDDVPVEAGRFGVLGYFVEGDLYLNKNLIGIYRFDRTDSNEPAPVFDDNPQGREDWNTFGIFYTPEQWLRLGLQYQFRRPEGSAGPHENWLQAEVWMIW